MVTPLLARRIRWALLHDGRPRDSAWRDILRARPEAVPGILERHGLTLVRQFDQARQSLFLVECPDDDDDGDGDDGDDDGCSESLIAAVQADPDVEGFEPNEDIEAPEVPQGLPIQAPSGEAGQALSDRATVPYYGADAWHAYVAQSAASIIKLSDAQQSLATGAGTVAVIDTGVDPNHPVFGSSLTTGFDFTRNLVGPPSEMNDLDQSTAAILEQSTAAILEQKAAVVVNQSTAAILEGSAATRLDPAKLPAGFGHGTMVAGLVRLVAPTATIMPLKAFKADGTSTLFDMLRAIYYAVENGADVINMSFSLPESSPELQRAITFATDRGAVMVASVGNRGTTTAVYPAAFPEVLGIASTNAQDVRSVFSNYGTPLVSLAAPGEAVITLYPGGNYAAVSGTSFSTALVSGGVALLQQIDPGLTQSGAAASLSQAVPLGPELGAGRLDLYRALVHRAQSK